MKKKAFAATLTALFTANVQATTVGLYLGGQIWQSEASGIFGKKNRLIDVNLKKEQQSNYFVAIEHPFPLLPHVRIASTALDTTGKTNLTQEFNKTVLIDGDVNVSYVDYTLYYELFDNGLFSFDFGLTARNFDGAVTVTQTTTIVTTSTDSRWDGKEHEGHDHSVTETTNTVDTGKVKTNEIEPMLYVATNISLPLTGLSVFALGNYLLRDDHLLYDYQVGLSYDLIDSIRGDFNLTLGYRAVKMEFENLENLYTDIEVKGAFFGVIVHF
ncbi:MAG: hypothetical protein ACI9LM_002517 [Alteromonadaceae bacterium]|jgi:hypothetical protein